MKKRWYVALLAGLMVIAMAFGFAACGRDDADIAKSAVDTLRVMYASTTVTVEDYDLISKAKVDDDFYDVKWEVTSTVENYSEYVSLSEPNEKNNVHVTIKQASVDVPYVLKASVTVGKATESIEFNRVITKSTFIGADVVFDFASVKYDDYKQTFTGSSGSYENSVIDEAKTLQILQKVGGTDSRLTEVTKADKVYAGTGKNNSNTYDGGITTSDGYLKFGTGSANGVLTLVFSKPVISVSIKAQGWKGNGSARVNEAAAQTLSSDPIDYMFTLDPAYTVTVETIGRAFLFKIAVTFAPDGTHVHQLGTTATHVENTWTHAFRCSAADCTAPNGLVAKACTPVLNTCSVCNETYTPAQIIAQCKTGTPMEGTYRLTGVISNTPKPSDYDNGTYDFYMTVEGESIEAYYCKMGTGITTVAQGDTVTIEGPLTYFNSSKIEFTGSATIVSRVPAEGGPEEGGDVSGTFTPVTSGTLDVDAGPYYFALYANETWYYLKGGSTTNDYWLAITTDPNEAIEIKLEEATDGYYFKAGDKYLNIVSVTGTDGAAHVNSLYQDTKTSVWKWDPTNSIFTVTVGDKAYFLGSYGNNYSKSMSASATSYLTSSTSTQYPGKLGTFTPEEPADPDQEAVDAAKAAFDLTTKSYTEVKDYELPTTMVGHDGVALSWALKGTSSNCTVEGNKLKVSALPTDEDKTVTLTVTFTKNGKTATKDIDVTIVKPLTSDDDKAEAVLKLVVLEQTEYSKLNDVGIDLPEPQNTYNATFTWSIKDNATSEYVTVDDNKLKITKLPDSGEVSVVLVVTVKVGTSQDKTKEFTIKVKAAAKGSAASNPYSVAEAIAEITKLVPGKTDASFSSTAVYVEGYVVDVGAWDDTHKDWGKVYIADDASHGPTDSDALQLYYLYPDAEKTLVPLPGDLIKGAKITVHGYLQNFDNSNGTTGGTLKTPEMSSHGGVNVTVVKYSVTDQQKVDAAVAAINMNNNAVTDNIALPATPVTGVTLEWSASGTGASVEGQQLTITRGETDSKVTLTLTAKIGTNATATASYKLTILSASTPAPSILVTAGFTKAEQTKANDDNCNSYTSSYNATRGGYSFKVTGFNNNNKGWEFIKAGRKNNAAVGTIDTNAAMTKRITKVVVKIESVTASLVNSFKLLMSSNADFSSATKVELSIKAGENVFIIDEPVANMYYRVSIDCAAGTSNGIVSLSSVVFWGIND